MTEVNASGADMRKVCPAKAIELVPDEKAVIFHNKEGARLAAPHENKNLCFAACSTPSELMSALRMQSQEIMML